MEVRVKEIRVAGEAFDIVITSSGFDGLCAISVYRGRVLVESMECSVPERADRLEPFFDMLFDRVPYLLRRWVFARHAHDRAEQPA